MALPSLIEIVPPQMSARAALTVPGSKSITNRALVLAALREGETVLRGALWSEDTQVMVQCLQELGFMVVVQSDPDEPCNRTIAVYGKGGQVPQGGTAESPLELFVGNAGTAARFLAAVVCLGKGIYRLHGVERMHQRPQGALFEALRQLGYRIDSANDRLPALIHGGGPRRAKCRVSIAESSQFASALLLCAKTGEWMVEIEGESAEESPYVKMTSEMLVRFLASRGTFQIEPDASSGSYFLAAGLLLTSTKPSYESLVSVLHWPSSGWQADEAFPRIVAEHPALSQGLSWARQGRTSMELHGGSVAGLVGGPAEAGILEMVSVEDRPISRSRDLGDSIMTAVALAPFAAAPVRFTELGRLRVQECERVLALRSGLSRCGGKVVEQGDTLTIYPSPLHGAEIDTYDDHRVAMCFAVLGLKVPGIKIRNPACVSKTFPDFFQKIAVPPPRGLGAAIRDCTTGEIMGQEELFAGEETGPSGF